MSGYRYDTTILGDVRREQRRARHERIRKLVGDGLPTAVIGERLGMTTAAVNAIARQLGLRPVRNEEWIP